MQKTTALTESSERFFNRGWRLSDADNEEALEVIRMMLSMLSDCQREVVELYIIGGMPVCEVARELCVSPQTVYYRAHLALKTLKKNAEYFFR